MQTPEQVSAYPGVSETLAAVKGVKPRGGMVSRLLAQFSRMNGEYVDFQMEEGVWRKLAF